MSVPRPSIASHMPSVAQASRLLLATRHSSLHAIWSHSGGFFAYRSGHAKESSVSFTCLPASPHPYTKIAFGERYLRGPTATKYLETLVEDGVLHKLKVGRSNYYINIALNQVLIGDTTPEEGQQA